MFLSWATNSNTVQLLTLYQYFVTVHWIPNISIQKFFCKSLSNRCMKLDWANSIYTILSMFIYCIYVYIITWSLLWSAHTSLIQQEAVNTELSSVHIALKLCWQEHSKHVKGPEDTGKVLSLHLSPCRYTPFVQYQVNRYLRYDDNALVSIYVMCVKVFLMDQFTSRMHLY